MLNTGSRVAYQPTTWANTGVADDADLDAFPILGGGASSSSSRNPPGGAAQQPQLTGNKKKKGKQAKELQAMAFKRK